MTRIIGSDDPDWLKGGDGYDQIAGAGGDDWIQGGGGGDDIDGGSGFDTANYTDSNVGVYVVLPSVSGAVGWGLYGSAQGDLLWSIEGLIGSAFDDTLFGNDDVNVLWGYDDNDQLYGLGGNDFLFGGVGDDFLEGGAGADYLAGGLGNDSAIYLDATAGVTASLALGGMTGDAAGDTYHDIENLLGTNYIDDLRGDDESNWIWGFGGADRMAGGKGNDAYVVDTGDAASTDRLPRGRARVPAGGGSRRSDGLRASWFVL